MPARAAPWLPSSRRKPLGTPPRSEVPVAFRVLIGHSAAALACPKEEDTPLGVRDAEYALAPRAVRDPLLGPTPVVVTMPALP